MDYRVMQTVAGGPPMGLVGLDRPCEERRTAMSELDQLAKLHSELGAVIEALISRAAPAICVEPASNAKAPGCPGGPEPNRSRLCQEIHNQQGAVSALIRLVAEATSAMEL